MKKYRNFNCPKCGVFERLVNDEVKELNCKCGELSSRTLSAPRVVGNTTGRSPSFSNVKRV